MAGDLTVRSATGHTRTLDVLRRVGEVLAIPTNENRPTNTPNTTNT